MRGRLTDTGPWQYLIALGSNRRHHRHVRPREVLAAALDALQAKGLRLIAGSPVHFSDPVGPSRRRYANSAALIETELAPAELLALLKGTEHAFGRRARGQRWTARVLDIDIVLWSDGAFASKSLTIPHPRFREREFVLGPAARIAASWRDPVTGLTVRQLNARHVRSRRWAAA